MAQIRLYDYGKPADAESENAITFATHDKGVYRGLDLGVDAVNFNLTLSLGYGVQHNGIVWVETDTRTLPFTTPATATNYTVVATHTDQQLLNGTPVEYSILEGLLTNEDVTNGVVLGWIYHPGAVPLDVSHLQPAPKLLASAQLAAAIATQAVEEIPAYTRSIVTSSDIDITFTAQAFDATDFVIYQSVANSPGAVGPETLVQQFQYYVQNSQRPVSFSIFNKFPDQPSTNITVELFDTDQTPVTLTDSIITGTGDWKEDTVTVDRTEGTFLDGAPYTLRLTFNAGIGQDIWTGRVVANFWPFP